MGPGVFEARWEQARQSARNSVAPATWGEFKPAFRLLFATEFVCGPFGAPLARGPHPLCCCYAVHTDAASGMPSADGCRALAVSHDSASDLFFICSNLEKSVIPEMRVIAERYLLFQWG